MTMTEHKTRISSTTARGQHTAKFFVEESDLYETLAQFVREGLADQKGVLVAATRVHWKGLTLHLSNAGVRIEEAIERDQLVFLDAEEMREALMVKGQPSRERFEELVGEHLEEMLRRWSGVSVYGEIVNLLAADSQFGPMRQLEEIWEEMRLQDEFELLSGYRLENFGGFDEEQPFDNVCAAHQQVLAADGEGGHEVARWQRRALASSKQLEQERQRRAALEDELEQERERNRRKDEFIGKFAHELRNPLAPILTAIEMMNLRGDDSNKRERGIIERQVTRLVELVDECATVSRVIFSQVEFQTERVETAEVVRRAVRKTRAEFEERGHELRVDVADSGLMLDADAEHLAQALAEMLENAAHFTPDGGTVWLQAKREAGSVAISVRDDGRGVEPALLSCIFDMFSRGESADHRGLGLGLALVQKVAEMHDGAVAAYSEGPSSGSEFVMRLPMAKPASARPKVSRLRRDEIASGGSILVVDDNEDFASMLAETLDLLGHDVYLANDAAEALSLLEEFQPDVALLDINLPDMTGHKLGEQLERRCSPTRDLRLVAVTGYSDQRKRERSEEMGFDAHLVKPIVLSQLQQTLDSVFDEE